jgi:DNA polymerase
MPIRFTIDFETRSHRNLKTDGLYNYVKDPSTDWLCLAIKREDAKSIVVFNPSIYAKQKTLGELLVSPFLSSLGSGEATVHAFNAEFEFNVWNEIVAPRMGWPALPLSAMRCSAARALAMGIPGSMAGASAVMGSEVQKDKEGQQLMLKMCKPDKHGNWVFDEEMVLRLGEYCKTDVDTEHSLDKLLPHLSDTEQKVWESMVGMNARGILCDIRLCANAVAVLDSCHKDANRDLAELTNGRVKTGNQVAAMIKELGDEGCDTANLQKGTVSTLLTAELSVKARRLLEARKEVSMASVKKFQAMLDLASPIDSRIRGMFKYYGGQKTGRFSAQGIQPQNLFRPTTKKIQPILDALDMGDPEFFKSVMENPMTSCANVIRSMLVAEPGHTFLNGDYNAIEARVLLWLADDPTIKDFRLDKPVYAKQAAETLGIPLSSVAEEQRQFGKVVILGSGYQMAAGTFKEYCKGFGINVSDELAARAIQSFRDGHPNVVNFWYGMERAVKEAIRVPGSVKTVGKLMISVRDKWLIVKLPSGRKQYYFKPYMAKVQTKIGVKDTIHYYAVKGSSLFANQMYGGKFVENATQGLSRDILAHAMPLLDAENLGPVLMVHDELMSEVPTEVVDVKKEVFKRCMETVPEWATGLPLKVGTWTANRYKK